MPTAARELVPIFRSETQARLLADVFFGPPTSGSDLARRFGMLQSTVAREIGRLAPAGVVTLEDVGRAKIVRLETASCTSALRRLVAYAAGVPHVVRAEHLDVDLIIVSTTHTRFTLAVTAVAAAHGLRFAKRPGAHIDVSQSGCSGESDAVGFEPH